MARPRKKKIDKAAADRAVNFIESLKHYKGEWAGKPFTLSPWQKKDIIRPIFGTLNPDGFRQYRKAYVSTARKNGKSELAAAVALKLLAADSEPGAEIYGAAADRDQAGLVFNVAKKMVESHPLLSQMLKVVDSTKRITFPRMGSFYNAIAADHFSAEGYDSHGIIFDELHTQKKRLLWDTLTTSTGSRRQPLIFAITTAGTDKKSICHEEYSYSKKTMSGVFKDPSHFTYIRELDEKDDWKKQANWVRANPALGTFRKREDIENAFRKALLVPAYQNIFRRYYLNQWTEAHEVWMTKDKWDGCAWDIDPVEFEGRECYGGLDLASNTDVAAFVLVFPPVEDGEPYFVLCYFWIPEENMYERVINDRVPYDIWNQQGVITATPGTAISYDFIERDIKALKEKYNIREIAFDRWQALQLIQNLDRENVSEMVAMGQGMASMSAPSKHLIAMVLSEQLGHPDNPVLNWMSSNMQLEIDAAENMKPSKKASTERIDGMVALIMGLDRALRHDADKGRSIYEDRGLLSV